MPWRSECIYTDEFSFHVRHTDALYAYVCPCLSVCVRILIFLFCINSLVCAAQVESQHQAEEQQRKVNAPVPKANEANEVLRGWCLPLFQVSDLCALCAYAMQRNVHQRNIIDTILHNVVIVVFHFMNFSRFSLPLLSSSSFFLSFLLLFSFAFAFFGLYADFGVAIQSYSESGDACVSSDSKCVCASPCKREEIKLSNALFDWLVFHFDAARNTRAIISVFFNFSFAITAPRWHCTLGHSGSRVGKISCWVSAVQEMRKWKNFGENDPEHQSDVDQLSARFALLATQNSLMNR